jgi:uncharacterized protein (DUF1499 family)
MEEKTEQQNRRYTHFAVAGFCLAVIAGAAEVLAGPGSRAELWYYRTGFTILKWAAYGGLAAGVVSLAGCILARPGSGRRGFGLSLIGLLAAIIIVAVPLSYRQTAQRLPRIHDLTTDTETPPRFVALLLLRKTAENPSEYGGPGIAAQQRLFYPEVIPLELSVPPDQAFKRALDAARSLGWRIVDENESEGRIEATDTTFWFGFKDDIVIRIARGNGGRRSRVDVRSVSRVGKSDIGTNARRIRAYLRKLRDSG